MEEANERVLSPEEVEKVKFNSSITIEIGPHGDMTYCPITLGYCPEQCPLHEQNKGNLWDKLRTLDNPNGMEPATIMMLEYTRNLSLPKERRVLSDKIMSQFKTDVPDCGMLNEKWGKIWNEMRQNTYNQR